MVNIVNMSTAPNCPGVGAAADTPVARCTHCHRQIGVRDGRIIRHSVSVFYGRWLVPDHDYRPAMAYPGVIAGSRHQFTVSSGIAEQIVADHPDELSWDGAVLVVADGPRVAPGFDGSYLIGWGWDWDLIHPDEVLAVAA